MRRLIVGSFVTPGKIDRRTLFDDCIGIDMREGEGVDIVWDLENGPPPKVGRFNVIECWSVLEHSRRPWLLADTLQGMLKPNGVLSVKVPFVWRIHAYPSDYWRFTPECVRMIFPRIKWSKLEMMNARAGGEDLGVYHEPVRQTRLGVDVAGQPAMLRSEVWGVGKLDDTTPFEPKWYERGVDS